MHFHLDIIYNQNELPRLPTLLRNAAKLCSKSLGWALIFFIRDFRRHFLPELYSLVNTFLKWRFQPQGSRIPSFGTHCCFLVSQQEIGMSRGGLENYQTALVKGWECQLQVGSRSEHLGAQTNKQTKVKLFIRLHKFS